MSEQRPLGAALRSARETRGWSRADLARRLLEAADEHNRRSLPSVRSLIDMIKQWEKGRNGLSRRYRVLYAAAFDLPEDELFAVPAPAQSSPGTALGKLLPSSDLPQQLAVVAGRRVGRGLVEDLAGRVHGLRLADDVLAGGDLLSPAYRELEAAVRLQHDTIHTENVNRALLSTIGEFAQIAGWIASDAGHHEQAADTYRLGISAAQEAGDCVLESNLLGSLAYQESNVGDPLEAVRLAQAALDIAGPHAPSRALALAWDRLAWTHARADQAQAAMRALGEADEALARHAPGDNEPGYLYWVDTSELQVMEARAYTELRRPLRAVPLLADVLSRYDVTHTRELALYLSWLAVALADANEPEEAAATARRMLVLSTDLTSERASERTRVVLRRLEEFRDIPEVAELLSG